MLVVVASVVVSVTVGVDVSTVVISGSEVVVSSESDGNEQKFGVRCNTQ